LQLILWQFRWLIKLGIIIKLRIAVFAAQPGCGNIFIDFELIGITGTFLMSHWVIITIVFTNFKTIKGQFVFPRNNFLSSSPELSRFFLLKIFGNFFNFKLLDLRGILRGMESCKQIWSDLSFFYGNFQLFFRLIWIRAAFVFLLWSWHDQIRLFKLWWLLN
jgi:hypothetical protein